MSRNTIKSAAAVAAVGALAVVPAALAQPPEGVGPPGGPPGLGLKPESPGQSNTGRPENPGSQGKGRQGEKGNPTVTYVFKGTYAGNGAVDVVKGNAHVKRADLDGTTVSFDLSSAKVVAADSNGDGVVDATDVATGDKVVVKARLPRKNPGAQPFAAKQLIDQT